MAEIQWVMHTLYRPTDDRQNRGKTTFNQVVVGSSPTGLTTLFCAPDRFINDLALCFVQPGSRLDDFLFTFRPQQACAWPSRALRLRFAARV